MVTIISYAKRTSNEEAKDFFALILQGGIHLVQSKKSGQFYATAKKASIASTFDENYCKKLIGTTIEGEIVKVKTEPYNFAIEGTNESVTIDYKWQYKAPLPSLMEQEVFDELHQYESEV